MTTNNQDLAVIEPQSKPEIPDQLPQAIEGIKTVQENISAPVAFMAPTQMPDLENMEAGVSLRMEYLEFDKAGQKIRCVFVGMTTMVKDGRNIPSAVFQTRERAFINAGSNLVNQVKMIPAGTPVEIEYKGKEKTTGGFQVKLFDVRVLMHTLESVPAKEY